MESGGFCEVTKRLLLIERNNFLLNQKVKSEPVSDKNSVSGRSFEKIVWKDHVKDSNPTGV